MKKIAAKTQKGFIERRKSQRLDIPIPVKFKMLPRERVLHETFCQNISGGGIRLSIDCPFKKGDRLKTLLHFPNDSNPVTAVSKVVWCKKSWAKKGKKYYDVGIQHIKIAPRDKNRFVFLFCEMMINYFIPDTKITLR